MPSIVIFNKALIGGFRPSDTLLLTANEMTLFWKLVTLEGMAPATLVEFYMEFSENNVDWFQEVDEQDSGKGVISMSKTVRTFFENNNTDGLADGTHLLSTQFIRRAPLGRVQVRVNGGAATAVIKAPAGSVPSAPPTS